MDYVKTDPYSSNFKDITMNITVSCLSYFMEFDENAVAFELIISGSEHFYGGNVDINSVEEIGVSHSIRLTFHTERFEEIQE